MTPYEFANRIAMLTSFEAIQIAQASSNQPSNANLEEQVFDAMYEAGREEDYADLLNAVMPVIEGNPSINALPYPVRKATRDAATLALAGLTVEDLVPSARAFADVFASAPRYAPASNAAQSSAHAG